jgi:hypothetical protein
MEYEDSLFDAECFFVTKAPWNPRNPLDIKEYALPLMLPHFRHTHGQIMNEWLRWVEKRAESMFWSA